MLLWSVIIIALATLGIGLVAFAKNTHSKPNILTLVFSIIVSAWIVSNYFSNSVSLPHDISKIMNHLTLLFGGGVAISLNLLLESLNNRNIGPKTKMIYAFGGLAILSSLTNFVVEDVRPSQSLVAIEFGLLSPVFFGALFFFVFRLFWVTFISIKRSTGASRSRLQVIGLGVYSTFGILIITNVFLPYFMNAFTASVVGPLTFILMVVALVYAIVKQSLFDIRSAIVRSLAYLLTIAVLAALYGWVVVYVVDKYLAGSTARPVLMFIFVVVATLSFEYLRRQVERFTAGILHRNRYNSQKVINKVADVLVSNLDEVTLIKQTVAILSPILDSSKIIYTLRDKSTLELTGSTQSADQQLIKQNILGQSGHLYIRPEQEVGEFDIIMSFGQKNVFEGCLAFGPKLNGAAYTRQDIELLDVLRKNVALALQNARRYQEVSDFASVLKKEVKTATAALSDTNKNLRDVSTTKDEFMSMVSHQLRPQLATSMGFIELIESRDDLSKADHDEFLKLARLSISRMTRLVADILSAANIQSGTFTLEQDKIDLCPIVESELKSAELSAKNAEVTITYTKPKTPIYVYADAIKLNEVIYNLLDNAVRYTPKDKNIRVTIKSIDSIVSVEIVDQGIGVAKKDKPKLFKKFYRTSNAKEARPSGTGIGLFVAKNIITAHKGKMIFTSTLGKGSTFGFTLPAYKK
jgi:signal transduction histidine kinase